ncbi:MAG: hypothetical protein II961_03540 [Candidatus Riflebacteria bacterium]|nr:hypothetical protein [Candidatus Riflebacteria bacterium]
MKKRINKLGLSLIELVVALPMLAFVFLGIAYMIAITGNFTTTEIAKAKTQTAANNILMLIKAERFSILNNLGFTVTSDSNGNKKVDTVVIPTDSIVHPDGVTNLKLFLEEQNPDAGSNISSGNKICVIKVIAPDFNDIQTEIKTVSF